MDSGVKYILEELHWFSAETFTAETFLGSWIFRKFFLAEKVSGITGFQQKFTGSPDSSSSFPVFLIFAAPINHDSLVTQTWINIYLV